MRWTWRQDLPEAVPEFSAPISSGQGDLYQPCPLTVPRAGTGQPGLLAPEAWSRQVQMCPVQQRDFFIARMSPVQAKSLPGPLMTWLTPPLSWAPRKGTTEPRPPVPALLGNVSVKVGVDELKTGQRRLKRPPVQSKDAHLHKACSLVHDLETRLAVGGGGESLS